jgi:aldehyde dehydrogenase (NAD+)
MTPFVRVRQVGLETVLDAATEIANEITDNYEEIVAILTRYETWTTAVDETERALRALRNLKREGDFIIRVRSGLHVAALLPINLPLYSLLLFGVMPALMGQKVVVRPSDVTGDIVPKLYELVSTAHVRRRLQVVRQGRSRFLAQHVRRSDVTIFTGSYRNAAQVLRSTPPRSCFIFNGSGVNPIVVAPGADLERRPEPSFAPSPTTADRTVPRPTASWSLRTSLPSWSIGCRRAYGS